MPSGIGASLFAPGSVSFLLPKTRVAALPQSATDEVGKYAVLVVDWTSALCSITSQ